MSNHMLYSQKSHSSVQHVQPISFPACLAKHLIACLAWFSSPRQKLPIVASIFLTNLVCFQRCVLRKTYSNICPTNSIHTMSVKLLTACLVWFYVPRQNLSVVSSIFWTYLAWFSVLQTHVQPHYTFRSPIETHVQLIPFKACQFKHLIASLGRFSASGKKR